MYKVAPIRRFLPEDAWNEEILNYTIIVGCSRLAVRLATSYNEINRKFVIIDSQEPLPGLVPDELIDNVFVADPASELTLQKVGIKHAKTLIAVSDDENINIVVGQLAKTVYNTPKVIVKLYDDSKIPLFKESGIETICPVALAADAINSITEETAE